ncbi:hypothetical protein WOLCODRAFT_81251 [Wolfiporia cocos MD-104 SS10]|uniref:Uncharacterized protein n=1 Tax=Wolfiporia cocos (strain MD-104) TaxID=742152 RepID=A0A2H3JJ62_WOLCO|nr:hypothetical protein WOLCODRAFT_81251 [Wolfiporia cocos MD-104 SS10]
MNSQVAPYNFSFTDQYAMLRYFPSRDGAPNETWNVSYSESSQSSWAPTEKSRWGNGTSAHSTTRVNGAVTISWLGTAIWLYGKGEINDYGVQIDNGPLMFGRGSNSEGLLFSQTDLNYTWHSAILSLIHGELVFTGGTITTGMGQEGWSVQYRTIQAATTTSPGLPEINPIFSSAGAGWSMARSFQYPRLSCGSEGSSVSFNLSNASGFSIFGSVDGTSGAFSVYIILPQAVSPTVRL